MNVQPSLTLAFSRDLTLQFGVSVQRVEVQLPSTRHELSSAAVSTLRFRRRWEASNRGRQEAGAAYGIRASTRTLSSDFVYSRHVLEADYSYTTDRQRSYMVHFQAGRLNGRAPLFERFVLGNSVTLRGWNKFDLAPFGADRMMHASFEYRQRWFRTVYDTGSVWSAHPKLRHSIAAGIAQNRLMGLTFLVAFPLREGRIEPIFMTGINF
jgi:outer membrane protein assembly factor BamA